MNILNLIYQHPLLKADLTNLGLGDRHLKTVAGEIGCQLGGSAEFNLCYVLSALNRSQFVKAIDVSALADCVEINPSLAQSIVLTIAPWVDRFQVRAI